MAAIVTDQFRISNANNFIESVLDGNNSYYVFLGLSNPGSTGNPVGFGRTTTWDSVPSNPLVPTDNFDYLSHYRNTALFAKKINSTNIRRVIRRVNWTSNTRYDMYRHDYSDKNPSPNSNSSRLYDSNYYVMNSDYRVYICLYNGSSGSERLGKTSKDEPKFTDLEPSVAGNSGDGYIWKYLFTVFPSDIIKFDSTDYIVLPNNWNTSTDFQIQNIRESADSTINNNQIKIVYIENSGGNGQYTSGTYDIIGDGNGAKVSITTNSSGEIISTKVVSGGAGYTYGIVDLKTSQLNPSNPAKLIPIIPPSRGHGYDIYTELGADKVLVYARFDDSTKDFPTDSKFSQVGIIKNPQKNNSSEIYTDNQYSSLGAIKLSSIEGTPVVGEEISQLVTGGIARGYVASYDAETMVLKYYQDKSLYFSNSYDQTDSILVSSKGKVLNFESSGESISPYGGSINTSFTGITTTVNNKQINLGSVFTDGLSNPEINKNTGDILYIDNRSLVTRDSRQKEDVKIILEF